MGFIFDKKQQSGPLSGHPHILQESTDRPIPNYCIPRKQIMLTLSSQGHKFHPNPSTRMQFPLMPYNICKTQYCSTLYRKHSSCPEPEPEDLRFPFTKHSIFPCYYIDSSTQGTAPISIPNSMNSLHFDWMQRKIQKKKF